MTHEQENNLDAALSRSPQEIAALCNTSQRQIHLAFGISRRTWGDWASGNSSPLPAEWLAIQHVLGIYDHPAARPESDTTTEDAEIALARTPREIAAACGITMTRLCDELFIPEHTLRCWSIGYRKPTAHLYLALQAVLGLYRHPAAKLKSTHTLTHERNHEHDTENHRRIPQSSGHQISP